MDRERAGGNHSQENRDAKREAQAQVMQGLDISLAEGLLRGAGNPPSSNGRTTR